MTLSWSAETKKREKDRQTGRKERKREGRRKERKKVGNIQHTPLSDLMTSPGSRSATITILISRMQRLREVMQLSQSPTPIRSGQAGRELETRKQIPTAVFTRLHCPHPGGNDSNCPRGSTWHLQGATSKESSCSRVPHLLPFLLQADNQWEGRLASQRITYL